MSLRAKTKRRGGDIFFGEFLIQFCGIFSEQVRAGEHLLKVPGPLKRTAV